MFTREELYWLLRDCIKKVYYVLTGTIILIMKGMQKVLEKMINLYIHIFLVGFVYVQTTRNFQNFVCSKFGFLKRETRFLLD